VHTLQRDLRTHAHGEAITALAIAVRSSQDGPASLELVDLRFMAETPGPPPEPDEPVQVEVHDDEGEAVGDAVVTFDAERVNWARSQTTDINGSATLTPLHTAARFDRADVIDVLEARGLSDPFPVQALTIPDALAGRDVCGKAKTGSGKTHSMIALGLLAREPELRRTVLGAGDPAPMLGRSRVVGFNGRSTDAAGGIWGSIAEQLGKAESFARYVSPLLNAPGPEAWKQLLGSEPLVLFLDELPFYLEYAVAVPVGNADLGVVTTTALANLFVAVAEMAGGHRDQIGKTDLSVRISLNTRIDLSARNDLNVRIDKIRNSLLSRYPEKKTKRPSSSYLN